MNCPPPPIPAEPRENDLLFAYGTLQRGGEYHEFLTNAHARFLGVGELVTPYPLVVARYPCLLDRRGLGFRVRGEVYRIPHPSRWAALDWLEDHPREYLRRIEPVRLNGAIVRAWTYFYRHPQRLCRRLAAVPRFRP